MPGPQGLLFERSGPEADIASLFGAGPASFGDQIAAAAGMFEAQRSQLAAALAAHRLPDEAATGRWAA